MLFSLYALFSCVCVCVCVCVFVCVCVYASLVAYLFQKMHVAVRYVYTRQMHTFMSLISFL